MPFIYNDEKVEYEDEYARANNGEYDRTQFAVVRKIFIRLNKGCGNYRENAANFNEGTIIQEFGKFGDINSVELLTNGEMEAYITFADDRSATFAFTFIFYQNEQANRRVNEVSNSFQKWLIEPANTWHQPHYTNLRNSTAMTAMDIDGQTENEVPAIFNLNEYCFEHLFKFFDLISLFNLSQVCKLFNGMLMDKNGIGYKHFQRLDVLEIKRYHPYYCEYGMTVGKMRKLLQIIGPQIKKIIFFGNSSHVGVDGVERFLEKINKYCGENIRELVLEDVRLPSTELNFQPMFTSLRTLKIRDWSGEFFYESDLQKLCSNLTKLKIEGTINIMRSCRHWPKLQCLSLFVKYTENTTFWSFIEHNPQLKSLKFFYVDTHQFDVISDSLLNIDKLAISCHNLQFSSVNLRRMNHLVHLSHLTLVDLTYIDDKLLSTIAGFHGLHVLKLGIKRQNYDSGNYIPNQSQVINLTQKLVHLEKFLLYRVQLEESTLLNVIRFAPNLRIIHLHYWKYDSMLSRQAIGDISHITQQRDKPLQLFLDTKRNWETLVDNEAKKFLKLNTGCCHARFQ